MSERTELLSERTRSLSAVGLATLPVALAGVRAAAGSWVPIGDDAYFSARSLDVATSHHPLLGAWSSGSADISRQVNNLGPIQLDLLAPFTKIAPMGGTAIGVVTVHIAAIVTIAWLVYRLGGHRAVVPAMAAVSMLTWLLGSEVLVAARQHQYLVVPYLCVLVAAWAATAGDKWALVPFVAGGSLVTQTHLSYPILVAALGVVVIVGQLYAAREQGVREFRVPWTVAVGLAALLWLQTAIDQIFGWGNLGDVLASPGEATSPGLGTGFRIVAHVIVAARGYVRPGFGLYDPDTGVAGDARTALFVLLLAAIAGATVVAFRGRRRVAGSGLLVAVVAMCAAVVDAASLPITQFGETGLTAANHRWLWSTTAFLVLGSFVAVQRYVTAVWPSTDSRFALLPPVVLLGFVVANLPASAQVYDPALQREHVRVTAELTDQLRGVELQGPVLVDQSHLYFGQPFGYPVVVVLRDRGIDYRLEGQMQARRFGESRVSDGAEPERLVLWHAAEALERIDDPNLVAYVPGPDPLAVLLEKDDGS